MRSHNRGNYTTWGFDTRDDAIGWQQNAACRDADPELFFADGVQSAANIMAAKAVCWQCPVIGDCRAWVAANPQEFGIWGGLTPPQRRGMPAPVPAPRPRWCQRCSNRFDFDMERPNARVCPACDVARERFGDDQVLLAERFGLERRAV